jgi:uncharacterized protein YbjT (DUF2867 family)
MTKAIVIGATGLTGSALVQQLLENDHFSTVTAISRRSTALSHPKFTEVIVDFEQPELWIDYVQGDVAFSTLGTTRKAAGSFPAQYRVDYDYQYEFAKAAELNGIKSFILLSSIDANARSGVAYTRMKGELDNAVNALKIPRVRIIRPGFLDGKRSHARPLEFFSITAARLVAGLGIARQYRPIPVESVAKAMIGAYFDGEEKRHIYEGEAVFLLAGAGQSQLR